MLTDNKIIHAFGVPFSPLRVSEILTHLRVGHTLVTGSLRLVEADHHLCAKQPGWPVVLPSVGALGKYKCGQPHQILFVCDALALLSSCNLSLIKPSNMESNLRLALAYAVENPVKEWSFTLKEPAINDYVTNATKPSFLNSIQTAIYKIAPYSLRKEIQGLIIGYLAGVTPISVLRDKLRSSLKLVDLAALMKDPRVQTIREATALYRKGVSLENVVAQTKVQEFEILYIINSSRLSSKP